MDSEFALDPSSNPIARSARRDCSRRCESTRPTSRSISSRAARTCADALGLPLRPLRGVGLDEEANSNSPRSTPSTSDVESSAFVAAMVTASMVGSPPEMRSSRPGPHRDEIREKMPMGSASVSAPNCGRRTTIVGR